MKKQDNSKKMLLEMMNKVAGMPLNNENKLTYTKITGYAGNKPVTAFVYRGADSGLNHYLYNGKKYMGTVQFSKITKEEEIEY